jgi:hypothetical protein
MLAFNIIAGAGIALGSLAAQAEPSYTTRIEPRPFYGATVTLEEGVRVFRPLPPHDRIIIVPRGVGPVSVDVGTGSRRYYVDGNRR